MDRWFDYCDGHRIDNTNYSGLMKLFDKNNLALWQKSEGTTRAFVAAGKNTRNAAC